MALIRRCARLVWFRTKHVKLYEKQKSHIINETNPINVGFVLHCQAKIHTTNLQYESNLISNNSANNSHFETNATQNSQLLSNLDKINGICYADVKKIVDTKSRDLIEEKKNVGITLLEYCRDMMPDADLTARRELVHRAWNLIENTGQTLTVEHYNLLLSIYAQNSEYLNTEEFLETMKATPNKDTYRLMLDAVAEIGDYSQALTIMTKIKDMGYPINTATFNSLILAYSANADVDGAQSVLLTMEAARIELSAATYCALSRGFAAKGDLENLERTLKTGNLNTKQLMLVVKSLSTHGHGKYISHLMKYLPKQIYIESKEIVYTIVELTHLGKAKDALQIVNSSVGFDNLFVYELVKFNTPIEEILQICESLKSSDKNSSALLTIAEAALRLKREDMALLAFKTMQNHGFEIRPHFYWPLLINAASNKRESDVIRLVKHMIDNKVYLDDETLQNYIIPFLSTTDPIIIVRQLQDCGIKISQLLTPFLSSLLKNGNVKGAITLTNKIKGKVNANIVIKHLLHGYIVTKNIDETAQLLSNINLRSDQNGIFLLDLLANEMVAVTNEELISFIFAFDRKKLKISKSSAEALEPRITRVKEHKNLWETYQRLINTNPSESKGTDAMSHVFISHPRDMNAEELENHLADLETKDMNTRGVLRRLVQTYCGQNNLSKAEKFSKIFDDSGFDWTSGMLSGMFSLYATHNMLDKAEIRYKELKEKHKGFKIDDHKIIDYATSLVNNKKFDRALEVLNEQKNIRRGPETVRNCWRLLNAVAADGDSKNIKKTLDLLIDKGYCEIDNHLLGPLVRIHLSNGDLEAAVAQFKECAILHKKLPLQQELIRAIVQTCNNKPQAQEQLTDILAVIKSIHGNEAANSQLFMALAATDKQKELHTFIKMGSINQSTLKVSVKKLTDENDMSALETILKACRGVRTLNNAVIYDSILTLCSRSGDYKTALQVWEKMQSEDVSPSPQFVEKLRSILKSQNGPLPPELFFNKGSNKKR